MPLPLGHTAIGLAAYEISTPESGSNRWRHLLFVAVLANLPDIDVVIGLLTRFNGNAFHRGPTHSLLFAVVMGALLSQAWRWRSFIPRIPFWQCCLIILSHVLADSWLTHSPVSFFWPFHVHWSAGHSSWNDVLAMVLTRELQDVWTVLVCTAVIGLVRTVRYSGAQRFLSGRLRKMTGLRF